MAVDRKCFECGKLLNAHSEMVKGTKPKKGDVSLCGYCGAVYRFDKDLQLVAVSNYDFFSYSITDRQLFLKILRLKAMIASPSNPLHLSNRKN